MHRRRARTGAEWRRLAGVRLAGAGRPSRSPPGTPPGCAAACSSARRAPPAPARPRAAGRDALAGAAARRARARCSAWPRLAGGVPRPAGPGLEAAAAIDALGLLLAGWRCWPPGGAVAAVGADPRRPAARPLRSLAAPSGSTTVQDASGTTAGARRSPAWRDAATRRGSTARSRAPDGRRAAGAAPGRARTGPACRAPPTAVLAGAVLLGLAAVVVECADERGSLVAVLALPAARRAARGRRCPRRPGRARSPARVAAARRAGRCACCRSTGTLVSAARPRLRPWHEVDLRLGARRSTCGSTSASTASRTRWSC